MQPMFHLVPNFDKKNFWNFRINGIKKNLYIGRYIETFIYALRYVALFKIPLVVHKKNGMIKKILFKKYLTK